MRRRVRGHHGDSAEELVDQRAQATLMWMG
jgi:hypothetical protein